MKTRLNTPKRCRLHSPDGQYVISLLASKSCEKRSKGIEQTWCRASKSARGDGKLAANAATPLQHASAGDSPPTTLLYFTLLSPLPQLQRARTSAFLHRNGFPVIYSLLLLSTQPGSHSQRQLPVLLQNNQRAKAVFPLQFHTLLLGNAHPYRSHIQPVFQE